jgi:hypothetical protein
MGVGVLGAVVSPLTEEPAWAVGGLRTVVAAGARTSAQNQVVTAPCPPGYAAVGGGAVVGGSSVVKINAAVPDGHGFTVLGVEPSGGTGDVWHLIVHARCAPAASLPGLEYHDSILPAFGSAASQAATAVCSSGRRLIGFGGLVDSNNIGQDRLVLAAVAPDRTLTRVTTIGLEGPTGFIGGWRVKAVAVCVNAVPGQIFETVTVGAASTSPRVAQAPCPPGTAVHAGGFDVTSGAGRVAVTRLLTDTDLNNDPRVQGAEILGYEESADPAAWSAVPYAVCAN